jgi:hypothetical protein
MTTHFCFLPPIPRLDASVFFAVSALRLDPLHGLQIPFSSGHLLVPLSMLPSHLAVFRLIQQGPSQCLPSYSVQHTKHTLSRGDCTTFELHGFSNSSPLNVHNTNHRQTSN